MGNKTTVYQMMQHGRGNSETCVEEKMQSYADESRFCVLLMRAFFLFCFTQDELD